MGGVILFFIFLGVGVALMARNAREAAELRVAISESLPVVEGLQVQTDGFGDFDSDTFPRVHVSGADLPGFARFGPRDHHRFVGGPFRSGDAGFDAEVAVATDDRLLTLAALDKPTRAAVEAAVAMGAVYDGESWTHQQRRSRSGIGSADGNHYAAVSSARALTRAVTALKDAALRLEGADLDRCLLENIGRDHDRGYRLACLAAMQRLSSPLVDEARGLLSGDRDPQTRLAGLERSPDPTPADFEALVLGPSVGSTRLDALGRLDALDADAGERLIRRLLDTEPLSMPVDLARAVASRAPNDTPLETAQRWAWHPDDEVRRHVVGLLTRLDDGAIEVLLRMIEAADPDVDGSSMIHVARALKWRADSGAVARLREVRPEKRRYRAIQRAIDEAIASLVGTAPRGALSGAEAGGGELSAAEPVGSA